MSLARRTSLNNRLDARLRGHDVLSTPPAKPAIPHFSGTGGRADANVLVKRMSVTGQVPHAGDATWAGSTLESTQPGIDDVG